MGPAQGKEARAPPSRDTAASRRRTDRPAGVAADEARPTADADTAAKPPAEQTQDTQRQGASKRQPVPGLSSISLRAVQATCRKGEGIPTVIKWPGVKAGKVSVEGTFTNWNKGVVDLQRSDSAFMSVLYLQPGVHAFRYIVDGVEAVDEGQSKIEHEKGLFNTISVQDASVLGSDEESPLGTGAVGGPKQFSAASSQERETYGQTRWVFEETRKLPPLFPPHLRYTPLTSMPPAEPRPTKEPVIPTPYHVTINHMYFQARDDYNVIGSTYRYNDKYSTVVYYRSQEESEQQAMRKHADPTAGFSERQMIGTTRSPDY
eukprot:TRINITY_DN1237_c6_g1_i1.p1 TRINITY_DN1237_c6_g1~~TRINITY_DN1237_c6_g1_i1.p1  ORF type:complete len:332 (+),score=87.15 TRINITY_DN1237_c6_g1_i1:43-996(+)